MIAHFVSSVNTHSLKKFMAPHAVEYYCSYNCRQTFISEKRFLAPGGEIPGSQEEMVKKALCHLHGNFLKIRGDFLPFPGFFHRFPFLYIDIRKSIIFFYKELSTFSTLFSTFNFSLFFNTFI